MYIIILIRIVESLNPLDEVDSNFTIIDTSQEKIPSSVKDTQK